MEHAQQFIFSINLYLHFDTRRIIRIKPPHATGICACISIPSWRSYSGFPLPDSTTTTCSWCYGFTGRSSNRANGSSTRCGRLSRKKEEKNEDKQILYFSLEVSYTFSRIIMLTIIYTWLLSSQIIQEIIERISFGFNEKRYIDLIGKLLIMHQIPRWRLLWSSDTRYKHTNETDKWSLAACNVWQITDDSNTSWCDAKSRRQRVMYLIHVVPEDTSSYAMRRKGGYASRQLAHTAVFQTSNHYSIGRSVKLDKISSFIFPYTLFDM